MKNYSKEQIKKWNQRAYQKLRQNPKKWKRVLKKQRARYARFGHKKVESQCIVCGKKWLGTMKTRRYCSQKCVSTGIHNGRWNGGKWINKEGYVMTWKPEHPYAHGGRYVLEHRLVMEKKLKRYLNPSEDVHHLNSIRSDNRLDNLKLMSKSDHGKLHSQQYWKSQQLK